MQKTLTLAICFFCIFFSDRPDIYGQTAAIRKLQERLPHIADSTGYVDTLNRIGLLMHMKDPDSCFLYAVRAKKISLRIKYTKGQTDADNNLAVALTIKGMHREALKMFSRVLHSYTMLKDTANIAQMYMNMATVYSNISDTPTAVKYSRKAIKLGEKAHRDSIMSIIYSNYCNVNHELSLDSSLYYIARSQKIAIKFNDERMRMINNLLKASAMMAASDKGNVLPLLLEARTASHVAGLEFVEISALDLLATFYENQPAMALEYYEDLYRIIDEKNYAYLKPPVLTGILRYAESSGNRDRQISAGKLLATAVIEEKQYLNKFVGDYVQYNELEESHRLLEITAAAEKKRTMMLTVLLGLSIAMIVILYLFYDKTKKQYRDKLALNQLIIQKNEVLKESDQFKNKLVSILAHDFRAPLISTLSVVEILKLDAGLSEAEMNNFYGSIKSDISVMLERFDSTLQWIRQQLEGYAITAVPLALHTLFDEAGENFNTAIQKKNLAIENNISETFLVRSDKEMLQFINRNLLSNAIKFSPDNGTVTIAMVTDGKEIVVSVADEGNGLDAKTAQNLFSISATDGTTHNGAGIALLMCRDFIVKLGGRIWAENHAGGGAVFYYSLPADQPSFNSTIS